MDVRLPHSPAEVAKVELVQFGILSPDEIVMPLAPLAPSLLEFVLRIQRAGLGWVVWGG
jgi:hypothetical protein